MNNYKAGNERLGKFTIPRQVLRDEETGKILAKMEFIPLHAQMIEWQGVMEYVGTSPMFEDVPIGKMVPTYEIICYKNDDGQVERVEVVKTEG